MKWTRVCHKLLSPPFVMMLLLPLLLQSSPAAALAQQPHLIFVMIDDWGYFEAGFRGNSLAQTPFVDKMLAEDALLIERHYSYRFCSPARRSFLSGRLPPHVGQKNTPDAHIDLRMDTIAEKLGRAGYATGRWRRSCFARCGIRATP